MLTVPYDSLKVSSVLGHTIYKLPHSYYGKAAGTLFILKEKSVKGRGRQLAHVYYNDWPLELKHAYLSGGKTIKGGRY